mmetsp:Transcript_22238/g.40077  ORF Transcript_22238/g.40077 Transcript_22238/m.40077 type:complete len:81 (+) Transcript_22238:226-468(+)
MNPQSFRISASLLVFDETRKCFDLYQSEIHNNKNAISINFEAITKNGMSLSVQFSQRFYSFPQEIVTKRHKCMEYFLSVC